MEKPVLCLVTPALAAANNGNWQTAWRWAQMLSADYHVHLVRQWNGEPADMMVALHACRSAASIAAWAQAFPGRPLAVVLTGTDLYRDILVAASAQASLLSAHMLIVLHELAPLDVPEALRGRCRVCRQSTPSRRPLPKPGAPFRALMVGHLREEKSPRTYFEAARCLATRADILLDHIGAALDAELGAEAQALQQVLTNYCWLGERPHAATRMSIQRAHVLVHASRIEGGSHVVMEAVRSGTPVLASRIAGNVGMLGAGYGGYFELGDATELATLIERCRDDATMLHALKAQCDVRAPLFDPACERATLRRLMAELASQPIAKPMESPP